MTLDFAAFTRASDLIHLLQGAALLLLGAAEAYSADNGGRKVQLASGLALALCGAGTFAVVLALPGGWDLGQLSEALALRRGFYIFIALACLYAAAGLSLFTLALLGRRGGGWQAAFLALLAAAGALYFALPWRVNEEAMREVLVWHSALGATLILAVAARTAHVFRERKALRVAWAALLMAAGLQLVSYKESAEAFAPKLIRIETSSETPPPAPVKNAAAHKERTADRSR